MNNGTHSVVQSICLCIVLYFMIHCTIREIEVEGETKQALTKSSTDTIE